jgi:hypothetical protein
MKERHYIRDALSFKPAEEYPFTKRWIALLEMYRTLTWTNISPPQGFQSPSTLLGILPGIEFFFDEKWAMPAGAAIDWLGKSGSFKYIGDARRGI